MAKKIKGYVEKNEDGVLTVAVASSEKEDRHGDVLKSTGWDLENFKRNPVIQWAHDPTTPAIGKVEEIEVKDNKLYFKPKFAVKASKLAREVYELYKEGVLRAFSVGYRELERDSKGDTTGMELLEISSVNVPANPDALVMAKQKGLNTDLIEEPKEDKEEKEETKFYSTINKRLDNIEQSMKDLADGFKHLEPKKKQGRKEQIKGEIADTLRAAQGVDKVNESLIKKLKGILNE